jgi:hypothetical protein
MKTEWRYIRSSNSRIVCVIVEYNSEPDVFHVYKLGATLGKFIDFAAARKKAEFGRHWWYF